MKLLLIEDDSNKSKQIIDFVESIRPQDTIELKKSYQSGLKEVFQNSYDLIFLDMQLPNFDIKSGEDGYKFRKLAGVDIMNELLRKKKSCKIIVITQFETFGEGENYIELEDLKLELKEKYHAIYLDTVYYNAGQTKWKEELTLLISDIKKK